MLIACFVFALRAHAAEAADMNRDVESKAASQLLAILTELHGQL
jgi:hypothetical protein